MNRRGAEKQRTAKYKKIFFSFSPCLRGFFLRLLWIPAYGWGNDILIGVILYFYLCLSVSICGYFSFFYLCNPCNQWLFSVSPCLRGFFIFFSSAFCLCAFCLSLFATPYICYLTQSCVLTYPIEIKNKSLFVISEKDLP